MATPIGEVGGKPQFGPPRQTAVSYDLVEALSTLKVTEYRPLDKFPTEVITLVARKLSPGNLLNFRRANLQLAQKSFDAFADTFLSKLKWSSESHMSKTRMQALKKEDFYHLASRIRKLKIFCCGRKFLDDARQTCGLFHLQGLREIRWEGIRPHHAPGPLFDQYARGIRLPKLEVLVLIFPYIDDPHTFGTLLEAHKGSLKNVQLLGVHVSADRGGWLVVLEALKLLNDSCALMISAPWVNSPTLGGEPCMGKDHRSVNLEPPSGHPNKASVKIIKGMFHGVSGQHYLVAAGNIPKAAAAMIAGHKIAMTGDEVAMLTEHYENPERYQGEDIWFSEDEGRIEEDSYDGEGSGAPATSIMDLCKHLKGNLQTNSPWTAEL